MSRFKNLEHFVEKAKRSHGETYDYSKAVYISSGTHLEIVCKEHGSFWQTPSNHYQFGCKLCGSSRVGQKSRLSVREALEYLLKVHSGKYSYPRFKERFKHTKSMITVCCDIHREFKQSYSNHRMGQQCPYCRLTGSDGCCSFYVIRLTSPKESFVKIGVTKHQDITKRTKHLTKYSKEVLKVVRGDPVKLIDFEKRIKKNYTHCPTLRGRKSGFTECFPTELQGRILTDVEEALE